jgi:hypothetical protein
MAYLDLARSRLTTSTAVPLALLCSLSSSGIGQRLLLRLHHTATSASADQSTDTTATFDCAADAETVAAVRSQDQLAELWKRKS